VCICGFKGSATAAEDGSLYLVAGTFGFALSELSCGQSFLCYLRYLMFKLIRPASGCVCGRARAFAALCGLPRLPATYACALLTL